MNKIAIFVLLGLAAFASANVDVDVEISDLTLIRPLPPVFRNLTNNTFHILPYPGPLPIHIPNKTIKPFPVNFSNKTNKTIKPFPVNFGNKTNKTAYPVRPLPIYRPNKTAYPVKPLPIYRPNKTAYPLKPLPIYRPNKTIVPFRPSPNPNITNRNRTRLLHHFKNFTKVNTSKVFDRRLPIKANTTEAVELFAKHIVNNYKNLTEVSTILQLVGELFLVGSQCEQDLGGAFYVSSVVAADVEAGFKDIQSDVIASVFVGLLTYQSTTDCPPVVQIIEELISIL